MMLSLLFGLLFSLLGLGLWRFTRDGLHPGVWMPLTWGIVLLGIAAAQPDGYFGVDIAACTTFAVGIGCFIAGSAAGTRVVEQMPPGEGTEIRYRTLAYGALLLHALMLPLWWREINELAGDTEDLAALAFQLRLRSVSMGETVGSLVGNYLVVGLIISPLLAIGAARERLPQWLYLTPTLVWMAANLLTNGRSALVQLVIVLLYIRVRYGKRLSPATLTTIAALFVTVFSAGAILVSKGDINQDSENTELASAVVTNLADYALQGPILYTKYIDRPERITPSWDALAFFCNIAARLDQCTVGPLHQEFLDFHADGRIGNVYTVFFSVMPKYGWLGVIGFLTFFGAWATLHHLKARAPTNHTHALLAAYLFSAVILSIFGDLFLTSLNFFLKIIVVCLLVQHALRTPPNTGSPDPRP